MKYWREAEADCRIRWGRPISGASLGCRGIWPTSSAAGNSTFTGFERPPPPGCRDRPAPRRQASVRFRYWASCDFHEGNGRVNWLWLLPSLQFRVLPAETVQFEPLGLTMRAVLPLAALLGPDPVAEHPVVDAKVPRDLGHRLVRGPDLSNTLLSELLRILRLATQRRPRTVEDSPLLGARVGGPTPIDGMPNPHPIGG